MRARRPDASQPRDGDAAEVRGHVFEILHQPGVAQQRSCHRERAAPGANVVEEPRRSRRRRRAIGSARRSGPAGLAGVARVARVADHQRATAVGTGAIQQRRRRGAVIDDGGAQAPVERRRHRQLVAGVDVQLVGEGRRAVRRAGVVAQELVGRGELRADTRGLAPPRLHRPLRLAQLPADLLSRGLGGRTLGPGGSDGLGLLGHAAPGLRQLVLELGELPGELGLAVAVQRGQRLLQPGNAACRLRVVLVGGGLVLERGQQLLVAGDARLDRRRGRPGGLGAVGDALHRAAGRVGAPRQLLALRAAGGQSLFGRLAALGHGLQLRLERPAPFADLGGLGLGGSHRGAVAPDVVARELPANLQRLALQPRMQLGRLGLALERAQPRARLALDVEGPVEVVLGSGQLELGAATALAVLAQPGRLLDEQPALPRLGGDQRLHPPLGDDRVHLLAQAGVREQLNDIHQPAPGPRQAVLALAVAVQAPEDGDLGNTEAQAALAVVQDQLHLGVAARLTAGRAAEDDVLHRLAAHRSRRLLAERPQHRVGDVGLPGPVGADDDAHARPELELGPVGERLEALDRDRLQIHAAASSPPRAPPSPSVTWPWPPARTARPPARRPSWSGPRRSRSPCRGSSPGP